MLDRAVDALEQAVNLDPTLSGIAEALSRYECL